MNSNYNFFCDRVCSCIDHATDKEKRAIHKELSDHMEDHAQALMELGRSEEEAMAAAIVAMGDPEEIGRELNKEFSHFWLWLGRISSALAVILALCLLFGPFWFYLGHAWNNIRLRTAPEAFFDDEHQQSLDISVEIPNTGDIARFIGYNIVMEEGQYCVDLTYCTYDKNIFGSISDYSNDFTSPGGFSYSGSGQKTYSYSYYNRIIPVEYGQESIALYYDRFDEYIEIEIELNWEGVE